MTDISELSKALNWKLLSGSHPFPGPDGGTCLNEAAVVVAGIEYRSVSFASDCPRCFSRPISAYAIGLNDTMPHDLRQKLLLPFVTRLSGSADTPKIEQQRSEIIAIRTCQKIVAPVFAAIGLADHAQALAAVTTPKAAKEAAEAARAAAEAARAKEAAAAAWAAKAAAEAAAAAAAWAAKEAAWAAAAAAAWAGEEVWVSATEILNEALLLGKQAEPIELAVIEQRAKAAKLFTLGTDQQS